MLVQLRRFGLAGFSLRTQTAVEQGRVAEVLGSVRQRLDVSMAALAGAVTSGTRCSPAPVRQLEQHLPGLLGPLEAATSGIAPEVSVMTEAVLTATALVNGTTPAVPDPEP